MRLRLGAEGGDQAPAIGATKVGESAMAHGAEAPPSAGLAPKARVFWDLAPPLLVGFAGPNQRKTKNKTGLFRAFLKADGFGVWRFLVKDNTRFSEWHLESSHAAKCFPPPPGRVKYHATDASGVGKADCRKEASQMLSERASQFVVLLALQVQTLAMAK